MSGTLSRKTIIVSGPTYFSQGDERAFFDWLASIRCVEEVVGRLSDLHIILKRPPGALQLQELIAVFYRYEMNMKPLAALKTTRNAGWFAENKNAYWHAQIFGKSKG